MTKERTVDPVPNDNVNTPITHTLRELEDVDPSHGNRYTVPELMTRVLYLGNEDQIQDPQSKPVICRSCGKSSVGLASCPHGTFNQTASQPYQADISAERYHEASPRRLGAGGGRTSPSSDHSSERWDAVSPETSFFLENRSPIGTPPAVGRHAHAHSSPATFHCPRGHPHTSKTSAIRCADRQSTRPIPASTIARSPSVDKASQAILRVRSTPLDRGPVRRTSCIDSQAQTPGRAFDTCSAVASDGEWAPSSPESASGSMARTDPPVIMPLSPGATYRAQFDAYDPSVRPWYVVTVGTRVGVFNHSSVATDATNGVSGQHYRQYATYEDAVAAFVYAEKMGVVSQKQRRF